MSSSKHTRPDLGLGDLLAEVPVNNHRAGYRTRRPATDRRKTSG